MTSVAATAPDPKEIEVSLFGPGSGFGECILVHLGGNRWIIVDSCINPTTKQPAALSYLSKIGVNCATDVSLVIASHWHDDHIRGLSTILEACTQAKFVCPIEMVKENFAMIAQAYLGTPLEDKSGTKEYLKIHKLLAGKKISAKRAIASRLLDQVPAGRMPHGSDVGVWSLSPSDPAVQAFITKLAAIVTGQGTRRGLPRMGPNDAAVVIQVVVGSEAVLLGSDLEKSTAHGWGMIVEDTTRPQNKSHSFKVSHHGSETGDEPRTWTDLLTPKPLALLTPFRKGGVRLPKGTDVIRIKSLAGRTYITVPLNAPIQRRQYNRDIEKGLRVAAADLRIASTTCGHVRLRFTPGDPTSRRVDTFDSAVEL